MKKLWIILLGMIACSEIVVDIIFKNSTDNVVVLNAVPGDNYPQLQQAINWCLARPWLRIHLNAGTYSISSPLVVAKITNGTYQQVSIDLEGARNAKDAPAAYTSIIVPLYSNAPALIIQQGKGCRVKNLSFIGQYTLPNGLSAVQIDTLTWKQWSDGQATDGPTNPYTAIAIDAFSDSTLFDGVTNKMYDGLHSYYLKGMNQSGSTAINIEGCGISNFVVGVVITPSFQENGELINITDCRIDYCRSSIGFTQAQSKVNMIIDFMCWGGVHTILDGVHFGAGRGDGVNCPMVDGMNIAGNVHQLIDAQAYTFPITIKRVYAEGLFKIGITGGYTSTHFEDCDFELQLSAPNVPSPDFIVFGQNIWFTNCMVRVYNGKETRFVFNPQNGVWEGGCFGSVPVVANDLWPGPTIRLANIYYGNGTTLNSNDYDSITWVTSDTIHVNKVDYTGYFVYHNTVPLNVSLNDLLLTQRNYIEEPAFTSYQYPIGYITGISGDTVRLSNIGWGLNDGDYMLINDARINSSIKIK